MKGKQWFLAIILGLVVPGFLITIGEKLFPQNSLPDVSQPPSVATIPVLLTDGTVVQMNMDQYLIGVLLGEVPADFEFQALKAQAVVARTYACKRYDEGSKHPGAAVCTQSSCCQAFMTVEKYLLDGGTVSGVEKIRRAVSETSGEVIVYDGKLIDATYFSCSGGRTEGAQAVWGTDIPYLQPVDSPGEEQAAYHTDTVQFTAEKFKEQLGLRTDQPPSRWFGQVTYTAGGGVDTIEIAGDVFSGIQLRRLLGLRSTAFVMTGIGNTIHVTTRGFGHRVGMSQYGAEAMAVTGSSYRQILAHYYTGTEIVTRN